MNGDGNKALHLATGPGGLVFVPYKATTADHRMACPYGAPGDRLWVRETWRMDQHGKGSNVIYAADLDERFRGGKGPWRPSIFMPRSASRITLEITSVRVERLQDITEKDIIAEGVTVDVAAKMTGIPWSSLPTLHHAWEAGWDFINGKRAPWASNPWVWVISFRRVQP